LWSHTDQTVVGLDEKAVVDDNGFRVGTIVGGPPRALQALLRSPRSCLDPRRWLLPCGPAGADAEQKHINLGPVHAEARLLLKQQGRMTEEAFASVQYQIDIEASTAAEERVRVRFTPRIEHGESMRSVVVPADCSQFAVKTEKPAKAFGGLSWEVTL